MKRYLVRPYTDRQTDNPHTYKHTQTRSQGPGLPDEEIPGETLMYTQTDRQSSHTHTNTQSNTHTYRHGTMFSFKGNGQGGNALLTNSGCPPLQTWRHVHSAGRNSPGAIFIELVCKP